MAGNPKKKSTGIVNAAIGALAVVLAILIVWMMNLVSGIQGTARIINYAGLVRGKTQRIVKLEISGQPQDPDSDSLVGTEYDILKLIRETAKKHPVVPKVYHAMGTEDVRYPVAMKIKETFESIPGNPYDYEYHEGPGVHEWVFWDEWIHHFLDTVVQKGGR